MGCDDGDLQCAVTTMEEGLAKLGDLELAISGAALLVKEPAVAVFGQQRFLKRGGAILGLVMDAQKELWKKIEAQFEKTLDSSV